MRAVIAATITRPATARNRPGIRFGLIDQALDPVLIPEDAPAAERLTQLKRDLAAVVSAEAFFSLTDLCALSTDEAIASLVRTAQTITRAALPEIDPGWQLPQDQSEPITPDRPRGDVLEDAGEPRERPRNRRTRSDQFQGRAEGS